MVEGSGVAMGLTDGKIGPNIPDPDPEDPDPDPEDPDSDPEDPDSDPEDPDSDPSSSGGEVGRIGVGQQSKELLGRTAYF